jgi:hypothetical protein
MKRESHTLPAKSRPKWSRHKTEDEVFAETGLRHFRRNFVGQQKAINLDDVFAQMGRTVVQLAAQEKETARLEGVSNQLFTNLNKVSADLKVANEQVEALKSLEGADVILEDLKAKREKAEAAAKLAAEEAKKLALVPSVPTA